jgi:hypothetical protein
LEAAQIVRAAVSTAVFKSPSFAKHSMMGMVAHLPPTPVPAKSERSVANSGYPLELLLANARVV